MVGSSVTDFEANFTQLAFGAADASGDITTLIGPGGLPGATDIYGIAYAGTSSGSGPAAVFLIGTTPSPIGVLVRNPGTIDGSGSMLLGSFDGSNIRLEGGTPIPEPSAFALLACCFGLGWVMVRRRV